MLIDSHCHLNFIDLSEFENSLDKLIETAQAKGVDKFLCVCVELDDYPVLCDIAKQYPQVKISVGLHPNNKVENEPDAALLSELAKKPSCIAIGETGLDYYRSEGPEAQSLQQSRFRQHIRAAISSGKPLIIHTRQAAEDTLQILKEEQAADIGGVMHCFSENWEIAERALALNFYISISGIVTFKNAQILQDVAKRVPIDRLLIETDAPYLAPVPFRGKQNHPALVRYVAEYIAQLRNMDVNELAKHTSENFYRCFRCS